MSEIHPPQFYLVPDFSAPLAEFCQRSGFASFQLVADQNTYPILGQAVEAQLRAQGGQVRLAILEGQPLLATGDAILQLFSQTQPQAPDVFVSVGSGTITDIVRFTSYHLQRPFISFPTAPSVDAYSSPTSALIVSGVKRSFPGQLPLAIFAHLPTLYQAPAQMVAAGFGDMLGKYTALADWRLGSLLWGEPYRQDIAAQAWKDLSLCLANVEAIAARQPAGIRALMESLFRSGLNMAQEGTSRPASGAEHHLAHYWEMCLLWENRPPILHGLKVGFATLYAADLYASLRRVERSQVETWLARASLPDANRSIQEIRRLYDLGSERVIADQRKFLEMDAASWKRLKQRVLEGWDEIQSIASTVPPRSELERYLNVLHIPLNPAGLGLTDQDIRSGLTAAHYLRDRLTVMKLMYLLNIQ
jgi:glycerol-1-phosphate dehydrogenase [NAD(P)+]